MGFGTRKNMSNLEKKIIQVQALFDYYIEQNKELKQIINRIKGE